MDVFSHFALPFLLVWLLRRDRREALAVGVGGLAPDLDVLTAPFSLWDPLYFLGHRGASHSLVGAPLYALGGVLLLRAPFWRRVLPIADEVRFGPRLALVAVLASYTHLALDATTMWGVPLLFPASALRFTTGWFFYSVVPMVPFSAWLVWRIARGTATGRTLRVGGAVLLAALLVSGGVRAATRPVEGDIVMPASGEWAWTSLERDGDGWRATFWSWGRIVGNETYGGVPVAEGQHAALDAALAHPASRAFALYAGGPLLVQVDPRADGGHNVTFLDLMERTQADRAPWFPFAEDAGILRFAVVEGRAEEIED